MLFRQFWARSACVALRASARTAKHVGPANSTRVGSCMAERGGRRFSIYVPEDLMPEVQRGLEKGRALQELMFEAGRRYVTALKRERGNP